MEMNINVGDEAAFALYAESAIRKMQQLWNSKSGLELEPVLETVLKIEECLFKKTIRENSPVPDDLVWMKRESIEWYQDKFKRLLRNLEFGEINWKKMFTDGKGNEQALYTQLLRQDLTSDRAKTGGSEPSKKRRKTAEGDAPQKKKRNSVSVSMQKATSEGFRAEDRQTESRDNSQVEDGDMIFFSQPNEKELPSFDESKWQSNTQPEIPLSKIQVGVNAPSEPPRAIPKAASESALKLSTIDRDRELARKQMESVERVGFDNQDGLDELGDFFNVQGK